MKYLPDGFKDSVKLESARATRRIAEKDELTEPPKEKISTIQKYANTSFVNVLLEGSVYTRLEKTAEKLGTTPDILISNALLLTLKKLEGRTKKEL